MDENLVVVGRVIGLYGVKGWVRIDSYTEPGGNIFDYLPWHLELDGAIELSGPVTGRAQGKGLVAQVAGIGDRDAAARLIGAKILVDRGAFPQAGSKEYYWDDLLGMQVVTREGETLGIVDSLLETGANDVLVLKGDRRRLIPFVIDDFVLGVDFDAGRITVDWDPEF